MPTSRIMTTSNTRGSSAVTTTSADNNVGLEDLPTDVLKLTFSLLGSAKDLLRIERTCTRLRSVVSDDQLWRNSKYPKEDTRFATHREHLCVRRNLGFVRRYQRSVGNVLVIAFSSKDLAFRYWRDVVYGVLSDELGLQHHLFDVRWDTLLTMLEILQAFLVSGFERALKLAISFTPDTSYPRVTVRHLVLQEELAQQPTQEIPATRFFKTRGSAVDGFSAATKRSLNGMIRRAAFRAGVPRLDNDVFDSSWHALATLLVHLWRPICMKHVDMLVGASSGAIATNARRQLHRSDWKQTIYRIPPYPVVSKEPCECGERIVTHTPVPSELEETARRLLPLLPVIYPDYRSCYDYKDLNEDLNEEMELMWEAYELVFSDDSSDDDEAALATDQTSEDAKMPEAKRSRTALNDA